MKSNNHTSKHFLQKKNIDILVTGPIALSMLLMVAWAALGGKLFPSGVPQAYNYLVLGISAFISGISGLVQIIMREAPGPFGKNKFFAIFGGTMWLAICWIASGYLIYFAIK